MNEDYTSQDKWNVDWSKKQRIQHKGYNFGKLTTKRKTSISLDPDVGSHLDKLKEEKGLFLGSIINQSLRNYFQLEVR